MKKPIFLLAATLLTTFIAYGQESVQELSKKASKGFLVKAETSGGNYTVTYKIPGDKKKNEVFYENYSFDNNLKFLKNEEVSEPKISQAEKPDQTVSGFYASVGGCNSFEVLSMKLKFSKYTELRTWDYASQRYVTKKTISTETVKPKNDNGKYTGYAAFSGGDQTLFVLAGTDSKTNKKGTDFSILGINSDMEISSKPVDITGSKSLVYSAQLNAGDIVLVFAPKKGEPDLSAYTYLRYSPKGDLKNKVDFKSPSNNLLIMDMSEQGESVFFCASSTKSKDAYDDVFEEYTASISNPCYTQGANKMDFNWQKKAGDKMDNFHLLKFTGSTLDFASTAPISEFKSKFKTSPADKGADPYKGSKFMVERFVVTPAGEYLVGGQLSGTTNLGMGNPVKTYEDIVCFHFDKNGQLKAQYGTKKMNDDKKSEIFPVVQNFVPAKDGSSYNWMIMEVKGFKGYADFADAFNGNPTFYPRYFPRVAKLDIQSTSVNNFAILGGGKYYMTKQFLPVTNAADNSITFIGSDEDYKKLWLNKYSFQ